MPNTGRDLLKEASDRIGGAKGQKLRAALDKPLVKGMKALDDAMTDAEYAQRLEKVVNPDPRKSWGLPN
jgi:hypothetical protein